MQPRTELLHSSPVPQAAQTVPEVPQALSFWLANGKHV